MPSKSKRKRGKHQPSKKGKSRQRFAATTTPQAAVTATLEPVAPAEVSVPSESVPTPVAKPPVTRYPYIATELRTIGILAGIMLIILVVLFFTLS